MIACLRRLNPLGKISWIIAMDPRHRSEVNVLESRVCALYGVRMNAGQYGVVVHVEKRFRLET